PPPRLRRPYLADVGPLGDGALGGFEGIPGAVGGAAVVERVGRAVDDRHHQRPVPAHRPSSEADRGRRGSLTGLHGASIPWTATGPGVRVRAPVVRRQRGGAGASMPAARPLLGAVGAAGSAGSAPTSACAPSP